MLVAYSATHHRKNQRIHYLLYFFSPLPKAKELVFNFWNCDWRNACTKCQFEASLHLSINFSYVSPTKNVMCYYPITSKSGMVSKRGATTSLATQSPDAFFTRRSLQQNHPRNNTSITWDATLVMEITYEAIDFRDTVSMMSAHAKYRSTTCFVASDIDGRSAWSQNQIHTQSKRTNILLKWATQRAQGKQEYRLEAKKVTSRCRWLLVPQSCQRVEVLPLFLWAVSFALSRIESCNSPPNPKAAKSHLSPATQRVRCVMKASRISPESHIRSTAKAAHPAIMLWLHMYVCFWTSRGHLHVVPESVLLTLAERQENSSRIRKFPPNGPSLSACCQQVAHLHWSSKKSESPPELGLILLVIMWFTVCFFSRFLEWVSLSLQKSEMQMNPSFLLFAFFHSIVRKRSSH